MMKEVLALLLRFLVGTFSIGLFAGVFFILITYGAILLKVLSVCAAVLLVMFIGSAAMGDLD